MASSITAGIVCMILVVSMVAPSSATIYTVGDSGGWTLGTDYSTWTSDKTFTVGDSLAFNYGSSHTVAEVSPTDYSSCSSGNAITSDSSGATTIALKTAGTHYFICGVSSHCGSGMKLSVSVGSDKTTTAPPATPSSGTTSPASPSGTTTPAITPPTAKNVPESSSTVNVSPFLAMLMGALVAFFMVVLS